MHSFSGVVQPSLTIAAFSDVHGPRYLKHLVGSASALRHSNLVLIAGDIVDKGNVQHCRIVIDAVRSTYSGHVFAVFGNEEYDDREADFRSICSDVVWLKDEVAYLEVKGITLSIIGTRGILDEPTSWQRRNVPNIRAIYEERLKTITSLLAEVKQKSHIAILLTHYAPICPTLSGERPNIWNQMGSRRLTDAVLRYKPDLVIHGHAHNSTNTTANLSSTKVYNVALPAVKRITLLELPAKIGLEAFF